MNTRLAAALACLALSGCTFYLNPQCDDGVKNGKETDVDCGGGCGVCALGLSCGAAQDCDSGNCASGKCRPLPCENGVRDGLETDVDCGGGECRKCAGRRQCASAADCFSGRCVQPAQTCFGLASLAFADGGTYDSGLKTYNLYSADMDGDGHVDLVAGAEMGSSVTVFLGKGDGTFVQAGPPASTGEYPTGGAIADLDKDGVLDVVTANYHGDSVSFLRGLGGGRLANGVDHFAQDGAETSNLAVGDLDGDGWLEVVATNPATGTASIFPGLPGGGLGTPVQLVVGPPTGGAPFSAVIADLDGDGIADLALAEMLSRSVEVRLGTGGGALGAEVRYPLLGVPTLVCLAADVTLDGKLDLVCSNRGSDNVTVLPGRGDGTFRKAIVSPTGVETGPYALAIADFDGDGVPDLVTPNYKSSTASVLLGVGDGSFELPFSVGDTGTATYGVATGDFDEDGKPDFAVCNALSNDMVVKLNRSR